MPWRGETQEGKARRPLRFGASDRGAPSRSEQTSGVAAVPFLVDGAGKRQERRGPERDTADREEEDPEGEIPWALRWLTGQCQARRGANRREGRETLRTEGAGAWKPRENRTCRVGTCRREQNPRRADSSPACRWGGGLWSESLRRWAKITIGATACACKWGILCRKNPKADEQNREGGAWNQISATGEGSR
jgi:hypothetical protein